MKDSKQNEAIALKCVACGDVADYSAARDSKGAPIWGLRDEEGIWGGSGPCGDWHRWVAKDDGPALGQLSAPCFGEGQ